jgi:hypothetical protein
MGSRCDPSWPSMAAAGRTRCPPDVNDHPDPTIRLGSARESRPVTLPSRVGRRPRRSV